MSIKLLLLDELKEKLGGISTASVYLYMARPDEPLPRPIRLSPGRVAWVASEIDAYLERQMAARDAEQSRRAAAKIRQVPA